MHPSTAGVRGRHHQVAPLESADSWKQLRQRYVSSTLSLRALAREAGVSYDALKRRARREGWAAARAAGVAAARRRLDLEHLAQAREEAASKVGECADHLAHALDLARSAVRAGDPRRGAAYLLDALSGVAPALGRIRRLPSPYP